MSHYKANEEPKPIGKLIFWTVVLLIIVCYAGAWLFTWSQFKQGKPEATQSEIQVAMNNAFAASGKGDAGQATKLLMASFKINGQQANAGALNVLINKLQPLVTMSNYHAVIDGNQAAVTADLTISVPTSGPVSYPFPHTQIALERKLQLGSFGFPSTSWKVTRVDATATDAPAFLDTISP